MTPPSKCNSKLSHKPRLHTWRIVVAMFAKLSVRSAITFSLWGQLVHSGRRLAELDTEVRHVRDSFMTAATCSSALDGIQSTFK